MMFDRCELWQIHVAMPHSGTQGGKPMDPIRKRRTLLILQTLLFGLFPLVCAFAYCLKDGHVPADVFLPSSYMNDELMYFKQVEAIISHGLPQGWFGYNEAHGSLYPFAAWSPVILLPWTIWGLLFGWSLTSPVYANIVFNMIALGAFALLVRPDRKQSAFILALLGAFVPYTRYMLSGMPEALCMSLGIWFLALSLSYDRDKKLWKLLVLTAIVVFLTLSRPYLGLFFLVPLWFAVKRHRIWGSLGMTAAIGVSAGGYVWITRLCCSSYVESIVETEWLGIFGREGLIAGAGYVLSTLWDKFSFLFSYFLKHAVKYGLLSGALYAVTGLLALLLLIRGIWAFRKNRDSDLRLLCLFQFAATAGMILALFLFYRMGDGSKHLMIFIVVGLLIAAMLRERRMLLKLCMAALCLYFFAFKALAPYDWQVPYDDGALGAETQSLRDQLAAAMQLESSDNRYDNTVIWLASDMVGEESVPALWGLLYAVPAGHGINFCTQSYVAQNLDKLQSRYIAAVPGGIIDKALEEAHKTLIAQTEHIRLYRLYEEGL